MDGEYDPNATYDVGNSTYDVERNSSYTEKQQDEQLRIMEEAQARILHQLSISQKENSRLQNEIEHLQDEVQRIVWKISRKFLIFFFLEKVNRYPQSDFFF